MFEAGSIIWRIQTVGKDVLKQDLAQSEQAAKKAGTALDKAGKETEQLGNKAQAASPKVRGIGKSIDGMSDQAKQAATAVGRSMVVIGAAIAAASALTVKAAIGWETAWTGVLKTVDGTPEELAAIEEGLRGLAKVLPASHTEIAAVAEAAGQLGVQSSNVVAFTKTMIDLGETTNLSANDAATALARFMNVMGTSQDDVSKLGSAVVELGNNYATTEAEIVAMAGRLSGASRQVGLSEGETLGLAAALSSVGIKAEAGGTAVSKVMIDIAASVDEGGDRVEEFAKIAGISADEFSEKWRTDPGDALAVFVGGLADVEDQGGTTLGVLADLGITETRMRDALLKAAAASDDFTAAMDTGNEAFDENNALTEEAALRYGTAKAKLDIMKNSVVDAAIGFGEQLLPAVEAVADGVKNFSDFMGGLPTELKGPISIIGVLAAGIALSGGVALLAIPKIVEYRAAVSKMGRTTQRASRIVTRSAGVIGLAFVAAAAAVAIFSAGQADAKARTEEFSGTLDEQTGKVTSASRELVKANLATRESFWWMERDSVFDAAAKLGLGLDLVTDAGMGNVDALEKVKAATEGSNLSSREATKIMDELGLTEKEYLAATKAVRDGVKGQSSSLEEAIRVTKQKASVDGDAADAAEVHRDSLDELAGGAAETKSEISELSDEIRDFGKTTFDIIDAESAFEESLDSVTERLGEDGFAGGLNLAEEAGRRNMDVLKEIAKDTNEYAAATADAGGTQEEVNAILDEGKKKLEDAGVAFGGTKEEAEEYGDALIALPEVINQSIAIETAEADARIEAFRARWFGPVGMRVHPRAYGFEEADGGKVNFYAQGGRENHVAQFARAGTTRVWAEPETGGEYYVPMAQSKRPRSLKIASQMVDEMGYEMAPKGGGSQLSSAGGAGVSLGDATVRLHPSDMREIVRGLADAVRQDVQMGMI